MSLDLRLAFDDHSAKFVELTVGLGLLVEQIFYLHGFVLKILLGFLFRRPKHLVLSLYQTEQAPELSLFHRCLLDPLQLRKVVCLGFSEHEDL